MKTTLNRLAIACLTVLIVHTTAHAGGEQTNVRGVGMARTFVASALGLDAVGINPANLAIKDDAFTLSIAPVGIHAGTDFFNYGLYNKYFTGVETSSGRVATYLDEAAKSEILNAFRSDHGRFSAVAAGRLVGISLQFESIGGFAFTITDQVGAVAQIPREYVQFAFYGNTPNSTYDFSATSARASWTREYALSFGGTIPHPSFLDWMSLGASIKLVQGFGYYEFGDFNTSLYTAENGTLTGRVSYRSTLVGTDPTNPNGASFGIFGMPPVGSGTGFDFGLAGGLSNGITFGISIVDMGKINWEQQIEERYADTTIVVDDPRQVEDGSAIEHALNGKTRPGKLFSTSLPTTFRAGVAVQLDKMFTWVPGQLLIAADFNQGLVDVPGTSVHGRFSTGLEWKPVSFLPLRTGVSFGGTDRINYALGFGIHVGFFDLDFASENIELLWGADHLSNGSVAVGTRFRF